MWQAKDFFFIALASIVCVSSPVNELDVLFLSVRQLLVGCHFLHEYVSKRQRVIQAPSLCTPCFVSSRTPIFATRQCAEFTAHCGQQPVEKAERSGGDYSLDPAPYVRRG
ncbi:hypothetical protein LX36DRAFT_162500 [Colletotrichum falcatum]|nr:hypothetical protein LX36DRAFT_162500 [Colletotrichum falcatum]